MIKFLDGPAAGQVLTLHRAPFVLRVVHGPKGWDALDQLDDTPADDEAIYLYRMEGTPTQMHVDYRGGDGRRRGEWRILAEYRFMSEQPPDGVMRDMQAWREWCTENKERILAEYRRPKEVAGG